MLTRELSIAHDGPLLQGRLASETVLTAGAALSTGLGLAGAGIFWLGMAGPDLSALLMSSSLLIFAGWSSYQALALLTPIRARRTRLAKERQDGRLRV
jgi:hypothetical protein